MKKISLLLAIVFIAVSCEGDRGPQGPPGLDGLDGQQSATIFEIENDFTPQNEYSFGFEFPINEIEVFEDDIVQVYLLEEVIDDPTGPVDVWTPLPTSFFFDDGSQLVYNFNHTFFDVQFFLGGNVDLTTVSNNLLLNQVFRIAVIPGTFAEENPDLNSMEAIMQEMPDSKILKIE